MPTQIDDPILSRFDEVIAAGEAIPIEPHERHGVRWIDRRPYVDRWEEIDGERYRAWQVTVASLLDVTLPEGSIHRPLVGSVARAEVSAEMLRGILARLRGLRAEQAAGRLACSPPPEADHEVALATVRKLCRRFHGVVRQLRRRHDARDTLDVKDEYDAQDLMHALLKVEFDNVIAEDPASTVAGAPSRLDFVLGGLGVGLELKVTRKGLADRKVGEEVIVDIERYASHPEARALVFFIYDPDHWIKNPAELEQRLTGDRDGMHVEVMVFPKP